MTPLLKIQELEVTFTGVDQKMVPLDKVSFQLEEGEVLCLVGESGSGKSVTSLSIMGLLGNTGTISHGSIAYEGRELSTLKESELNTIRGKDISMIFQDVMNSLNPVLTIGYQLVETLISHGKMTKKEARAKATGLLTEVGLSNPQTIMKKYPHTLSGGMKQRVMIAMALANEPKVLIADEPTTALDVTIQAQIMNLLRKLNLEHRMSIILVTHDMGVVAEMASRVLVMYAGQIVEEALVDTLFTNPRHPYTKALLRAIPSGISPEERLASIDGIVPEQYDHITGCRFANRCPYAEEECLGPQDLIPVESAHLVRCIKNDRLQEIQANGDTNTPDESRKSN